MNTTFLRHIFFINDGLLFKQAIVCGSSLANHRARLMGVSITSNSESTRGEDILYHAYNKKRRNTLSNIKHRDHLELCTKCKYARLKLKIT